MTSALADSAPHRRLLLRHPPGVDAPKQAALEAALRAAIERQQRLAERNPLVVPVCGLIVDADGFWIEEPATPELETRLHADPLDEPQVAALGVQLCDALLTACYPHDSLPRPHGALRPRCIFVADDSRLRLSDVGIAAAIAQVLGPTAPREELDLLAPYVARELWLAPDALGELRDLFAAGVVLYELATGAHPYGVQRDDYNDCEQRILTAEPRPARDARPGLSASLDAVLNRAVARREDERFPTLVDLRDALLPIAGAATLQAATALPDEACCTDIAGAARPEAGHVAELSQRFACAVAERTGWLAAESLTTEIERYTFGEDGASGQVNVRVSCPPTVAKPVAAEIALACVGGKLRVAQPGAAQAALLDGWRPAALAAQQSALPQIVAALRAGPFPKAEVLTRLEAPVPATLATVRLLPAETATCEIALTWNAANARWTERDTGSLATAAVGVARDAATIALRRELRDATDALGASIAEIAWELTPQAKPGELPAEFPFTVALRWQPAGRPAETLETFEARYPLAPDRNRTRAFRRAERKFLALRSAAPAGQAGAPARRAVMWVPLGIAGVVLAASVGVWLMRPGPPVVNNNAVEPNETRGLNSNAAQDNASEQPATTSLANANTASDTGEDEAARRTAQEQAARGRFDDQIIRLRELATNYAALSPAALQSQCRSFLANQGEQKDFLTETQQAQLADVEKWKNALSAFEAQQATASRSGDLKDLAGLADAIGQAVAWPQPPPAALQNAFAQFSQRLQQADQVRDTDRGALGFCLADAAPLAANAAQQCGLAAELPALLSAIRSGLIEERQAALAPAFTAVEAWLAAHPAPPTAWAEHIGQIAVAVEARRQFDALQLYVPKDVLATILNDPTDAASPASATLDGLLRWDELTPTQQQTIAALLNWTTVRMALPPASDRTIPPISLACVPAAEGSPSPGVWLARTETTVTEFLKVAQRLPADNDNAADLLPVNSTSIEDAQAYCAALVQLANVPELVVRLPTADEWQRALLAGRPTLLDSAPDLRRYDPQTLAPQLDLTRANFRSDEYPAGNLLAPGYKDGFAEYAPAASYAPNAWQLYDLLGNVQELVSTGTTRFGSRGGSFALSAKAEDPLANPAQPEDVALRGKPRDDVGFRIAVEWLP